LYVSLLWWRIKRAGSCFVVENVGLILNGKVFLVFQREAEKEGN
jgi:hypothetical protein